MAIRNMDKITLDGDQIKFPASAILQEDLEGDISELKEDFNQNIYGIDNEYSVTAGATNKFRVLLVKDQWYTVTNNSGVNITVVLYKDDGTSNTISSQLADGSSITFKVDAEDYTQIGGWVNSGATGTVKLQGEYSILGLIDGVEKQIDDTRSEVYQFYDAPIDTTESGWRLNESNGLCISNASYKMEEYRVTAGALIKVVSDDRFQFQTGANVPTYGANNRVGITYGVGTFILTVPDTATYLIVSTPTTSNASVYFGKNKIDKFGTLTKSGNVSVLDDATRHANEFYNSNNQIYAGGGQWDYYTLPVTAGDTFTIDTVAGGTVRGWAFRDASSNQLSIASYSGDVTQKEYTDVVAPLGAVELIVNFKFVSGYLTIVKNDELLINENKIYYNGVSLPKYLDRLSQKSNILYGKTLVCCGDSITYGADMSGDELVTPEIESYQYSAYTKRWTRWTAEEPAAYGYQIAARNDMIFYNGGVSGACVQGSGGTGTVPGFSVADGEYTLLPDSIDYMTLFFGWNDAAFGSLGTINDTTNDSYYGGYNVVLPYLINNYPYTKIALIVPFGTDVGHRQAIRDLANKWGLACFDMMQGGTPLYWGKESDIDVDSAIITANRAKFSAQANSPHPNIHGHYQISTMLEAFLRGI